MFLVTTSFLKIGPGLERAQGKMLSVQAGGPECGSQHSYKGCVVACVCNPSVGRGGDSVKTWVGPGGSLASQPSQNDKLLCHRDTAWKGRWGMIEEDLTHTHTPKQGGPRCDLRSPQHPLYRGWSFMHCEFLVKSSFHSYYKLLCDRSNLLILVLQAVSLDFEACVKSQCFGSPRPRCGGKPCLLTSAFP